MKVFCKLSFVEIFFLMNLLGKSLLNSHLILNNFDIPAFDNCLVTSSFLYLNWRDSHVPFLNNLTFKIVKSYVIMLGFRQKLSFWDLTIVLCVQSCQFAPVWLIRLEKLTLPASTILCSVGNSKIRLSKPIKILVGTFCWLPINEKIENYFDSHMPKFECFL